MDTLKNLAKEAKLRIKDGYWQRSKREMQTNLNYAKENGLDESKVASYIKDKIKSNLKNDTEQEEFYNKVKRILDQYGEVSDMLGRLSDKEYLSSLGYEQRQRYFLELSEKYRNALARYKREKEIFGKSES